MNKPFIDYKTDEAGGQHDIGLMSLSPVHIRVIKHALDMYVLNTTAFLEAWENHLAKSPEQYRKEVSELCFTEVEFSRLSLDEAKKLSELLKNILTH